jgi:2,4-dienoyl-CoA reductase-like NADH-dependent reductase (Old Yellow Enzyme family)
MVSAEGVPAASGGEARARGPESKLFTPLKISNGAIELKHRIVLAPMTRNRGVPLWPDSTEERQNRVWLPDELVAEYYAQRASEGGLLVTESILPNAESGAMPGVPGMWLTEHLEGWKLVRVASR